MQYKMEETIQFLSRHNIEYVLHKHMAVFTCEEAEANCGDIPGMACKNLLLRNRKKSRFFLLILPHDMQTAIKKFSLSVGEKNLSFANSDILMEKLGLTPGSVSPFGLLNDTENAVEVFIHQKVYNAEIITFHPNINTATLELTRGMFHEYLDKIEQQVTIIDL